MVKLVTIIYKNCKQVTKSSDIDLDKPTCIENSGIWKTIVIQLVD